MVLESEFYIYRRYVLELTTIKGKSMQFQAECSSVPDHIKLYQEKYPNVNATII